LFKYLATINGEIKMCTTIVLLCCYTCRQWCERMRRLDWSYQPDRCVLLAACVPRWCQR